MILLLCMQSRMLDLCACATLRCFQTLHVLQPTRRHSPEYNMLVAFGGYNGKYHNAVSVYKLPSQAPQASSQQGGEPAAAQQQQEQQQELRQPQPQQQPQQQQEREQKPAQPSSAQVGWHTQLSPAVSPWFRRTIMVLAHVYCVCKSAAA
jgi:hypothetical protein